MDFSKEPTEENVDSTQKQDQLYEDIIKFDYEVSNKDKHNNKIFKGLSIFIFIILSLINVISFAGLGVSIYFYVTDSTTNKSWKFFGLIASSYYIVLSKITIVFIAIGRYKKKKESQYEVKLKITRLKCDSIEIHKIPDEKISDLDSSLVINSPLPSFVSKKLRNKKGKYIRSEYFSQSEDADDEINKITNNNLARKYVIVNEAQPNYNMRRNSFGSFGNQMTNIIPYQTSNMFQTMPTPAAAQMYYTMPQMSYYPTFHNGIYY